MSTTPRCSMIKMLLEWCFKLLAFSEDIENGGKVIFPLFSAIFGSHVSIFTYTKSFQVQRANSPLSNWNIDLSDSFL
ncbi:hypothetical protein BDZ97DRAFT_1829866 [Flammula alnicola]|nr:hypothetical protein BDZ97DRAFT_1829866 [Flammula alnicola]